MSARHPKRVRRIRTALPEKPAFSTSEIARIFKSYPVNIQDKLLLLRQLIFDVAAETEGVGELDETLKWGQPAYVTKASGSGTTIRIDCKKTDLSKYAIYFHCQTNLIETFRAVFSEQFTFEGNRAIIFDKDDEVPVRELRLCISAALTYHRGKKSGRSA